MEFEWGGTRYSFTFGFFAVLALWLLCDRSGLGLPALGGVLVHEGGHILVMRLTGARILAMRFCAVGVRLEKRGLLSYGRETAVYLGGVAANLLAAGACVLLCGWNGFAAANLALCIFNLLPVGRLDGRVLLGLALCRAGKPEQAAFWQKLAGFAVLTPLFAAALLLLPRGNYTMLLTALYLAATLLRG